MAKEVRSADELVRRLVMQPDLLKSASENPSELWKLAEQVGKEMPTTLETDITIYRMVVAIIGMVAVTAVIGAIVIVGWQGDAANSLLTALVSISSASIGALAGLLSPVSFRR
jgi:hypothetical protein